MDTAPGSKRDERSAEDLLQAFKEFLELRAAKRQRALQEEQRALEEEIKHGRRNRFFTSCQTKGPIAAAREIEATSLSDLVEVVSGIAIGRYDAKSLVELTNAQQNSYLAAGLACYTFPTFLYRVAEKELGVGFTEKILPLILLSQYAHGEEIVEIYAPGSHTMHTKLWRNPNYYIYHFERSSGKYIKFGEPEASLERKLLALGTVFLSEALIDIVSYPCKLRRERRLEEKMFAEAQKTWEQGLTQKGELSLLSGKQVSVRGELSLASGGEVSVSEQK